MKVGAMDLVSAGKNLTIEALHGNNSIFRSGVFKITDPNFANYKLRASVTTTADTPIEVYEFSEKHCIDNSLPGMISNVSIFLSLNSDLDKLVLTQTQIIRFCIKYPELLCWHGYGTFFLIKVDGEYLVVHIHGIDAPGQMDAMLGYLEDEVIFDAGYHRRIVVPLISKS